MNAPLFDSHCHLDFDSFEDDFSGVLERARAASIARITTIGCVQNVEQATLAIDIARNHADWISAALAVHPHDAKSATPEVFSSVESLVRDPAVVAVGETGLDYHHDHSPREVQQEVFRRFIQLAKAVRKPIVVHTRNAAADTIRILSEEGARDVGGIIHCFSETPDFARKALDLGFVSSFSGIVTFKNAADIREAARRQPKDALLVETDAPFLAPVPHRGQRNEPSFLARTVSALAELRGDDEDELRWTTTRNACRIFGVSEPSAH